MKKLLLLALGLVTLLLSIFLGYSFGFGKKNEQAGITKPKSEILKIGLVADSHNENDLLSRVLIQAKELRVDFVIGLGDYTNLGTVEELSAAKKVFDESGLQYFVTAGDRDGWDSRERGEANSTSFNTVFGPATQKIEESGVVIILLDNSDIYKGISQSDWSQLNSALTETSKLKFVFTHKTPFHPDSLHIMGEDSPLVAQQAKELLNLLESKKIGGLFCGDLHFFAQFYSPSTSVKITTIGAVASDRNFQGPRFGILTVFDDYSWKVEDVGI